MSFRHDAPGTSAARWRAHGSWSRLPPLEGLDADHLDRVVVLAAHPDDESLGAGGLIATAHDRGLEVDVVVATAGEGSHPRSPTHPPARLAELRRREARLAVEALAGPHGARPPEVLDLPDGDLAGHEEELTVHLVQRVGDGRRTLLVAPWRHDGHPDHEAAGRAAATAAARTGARLLEHPVWWWHWADPQAVAWPDLRALPLTPPVRARKAEAIGAHRSQVAPLSPAPGDAALLTEDLLAHFGGDREVYVVEPVRDGALDDLHAEHADPWGVDVRWYEQRKRAVVLASLPRPTYDRGLEVGCSTGALTADLAERCRGLVALDSSAHAVAAARARLAGRPHVEVRAADVPDEWAEGRFDLVVISEVAYFLSPAALDRLVDRVRASLTDDATVVLCHWRHPVRGWVLDGPQAHARLRRAGLPPVAVEHAEPDFELLVLAAGSTMPSPSG